MGTLSLHLEKRLCGSAGPFTLDTALTIPSGSAAALYGPSGAGKTTLLRIVAGLDTPDYGHIDFDGDIWFDSSRRINVPPHRRRIGFVFQEYGLFPAMTVEQNITYGMRENRNREWAFFLMEAFGLAAFRDSRPASLSGGQCQRTALARALAGKPSLLLLDEPLSAIDAAMRASLQEELNRLQDIFTVTTILVSHDLAEIFRLSNMVYHLKSGTIIESGPPAAVFRAAGDRLQCTGTVLAVKPEGVIGILTIVIGGEISRIALPLEEAHHYTIGDHIAISIKAFTPTVTKLATSDRPPVLRGDPYPQSGGDRSRIS